MIYKSFRLNKAAMLSVFIFLCFLCACSDDLQTETRVSEIEEDTDFSRCQIKISADYNCDIVIPEPRECIGKSCQIIMYNTTLEYAYGDTFTA